jgi:uncharacterized membrane protein YGL010W
MQPIRTWLTEYGASHLHPTNKRIHWFCVPAIYFAIAGLLWPLPFGYMALVLPLIWYAWMSRPIFVGMVGFTAAIAAGCMAIEALSPVDPWIVHSTIFVVAWIFQFVGHKIEGQKPSFFKDVQFLLVGPAWLMSFVYDKFGIAY